MAKFSFHTKPETREELNEELPDGEPWGQYILECVEMRKKVESRELVLTNPDTLTVEEKRADT